MIRWVNDTVALAVFRTPAEGNYKITWLYYFCNIMFIIFNYAYLFMYYDGELWLRASKVYTFRHDKHDIFI